MRPYSRPIQRWSWVIAGISLAGILGTAGCGGGETNQADARIGIETSQFGVVVDNRTGAPLTDVTVTVQAAGLPYTKKVSRIESAQQFTVSIDDFAGPDGTHLSLRAVTPTTVSVKATDIVGNNYDVQRNWR